MVCNPEIFEYLKDDTTVFEQEPMKNLASKGELKVSIMMAFGSVWIPREKKICWKICGRQEMLHGKCGISNSEYGFL